MTIHFPSRTGTVSAALRFTSPAARPSAAAFEISPASLLEAHPGETRILAMDVTGSGRADLVQIWTAADGQLHATTYLAETAASGGVVYRRAADSRLGSFGSQHQILQGDLDGDGRADLLVAYASGPVRELHLAAFLSNGSGFGKARCSATGHAFSQKHLAFYAMDTSGDGRADLVEVYERADPARGGLLAFRTYPSLFGDGDKTFGDGVLSKTGEPTRPAGEVLGFWPLAASGGAAAGLVRVYRRACDDHAIAETFFAAAAPGGTRFGPAVVCDLGAFPLANQQGFLLADVDGDGIADLIQAFTEITEDGSRLHLTTFFGRADGRFVAGPACQFENASAGAFHLLAAGEGRSPLLIRRFLGSGGRLVFATYRATQAGFFRHDGSFDAGAALPGVGSALYLTGDADGDGRNDLLRLRRDAAGGTEAVAYLARGPQAVRAERPAAGGLRRARRLGSEAAAGG